MEMEDAAGFSDRLLCTALDVGEHLLICGGDIHRVEDTIIRICRAFGAVHTEAFTITSVIVASVRMPDGTYAHQMRRVYGSSNNMAELETLNSISRRLCAHEMTLDEAQAAVKAARHARIYPWPVYCLGAALAAGGFAVFFGGTVMDGVAAALVGVLLTLIDRFLPVSSNQMAHMVFNSFIAGMAAIFLVHFGAGAHLDKVMIGAIMLLIPGVAIGTSMQDLLGGELISGSIRFIQAILLAAMIAFGFTLSMYAFRNLAVPDSAAGVPGDFLVLATSAVGTLGFALVFNTRARHVPFAVLGGVVACLVYLIAYRLLEQNLFLANMFGALAGAWFSYICARLRRAPRNIFTLACMIPLVPGGSLYYTMSNLIARNAEQAAVYGANTLRVALGIAAGMILASVTVDALNRVRAAARRKR